MRNLVAVFLFLMLSPLVKAQYVFKPGALPDKISIVHYAGIKDAGFAELAPEFVTKNIKAIHFTPMQGEYGNLGFTNHNFWVHFELVNQLKTPLLYYLEAAEPMTDNVNLYLVDSAGRISTQKNGDNLPFSARSVLYRKPVFKIELQPGERKIAFLEIKNDGEKNSLPINLISQQDLLETTYHDQIIMGAFYGVLFVIVITYTFFFFAMKEKSFLFYSMYVLFAGLCQFSLDGLYHQYIDQWNSWLSLHSVILFAIAASYFFGKYSEEILDIKNKNSVVHRCFMALYFVFGLTFFGILFFPSFLHYSYPVVNILTLLGMLLIVAAILTLVIRRQPLDPFYTVGISIMFLSFTIVILLNFGIVSNSLSIDNITKLGIGLEIMALSLSMANRIRLLKTRKEELQTIALQRSEEMNDMKSYFLSNMSHELRTPLNAILGLTNIMENETEDIQLKSNFEVIKYASYSLISSINDILDFSKIEKGELKLEEVKFEPLSILKKVSLNCGKQAEAKGLAFDFTSSFKDRFIVTGDPVRLEQIMNNIVNNAVKFTPFGAVSFNVAAVVKDRRSLNLTITISDTGVGISKEKLSSIFEMFSQVDIDNKRKFGGFGIGLCVTKALVDLKKGKISIQSKENEGTTCKVVLGYPLVIEEVTSVNSYPTDVFNLFGKHILVVEDNQMNQMVIKLMMKKWLNTQVSFANDGAEALEALKQLPIDLVLMDLQMPVMDGYEATEAIRSGKAGEHNIDIPIVVLTADVMESTKERVFKLGVNDYMTKPVDQGILYQKITDLLSSVGRFYMKAY